MILIDNILLYLLCICIADLSEEGRFNADNLFSSGYKRVGRWIQALVNCTPAKSVVLTRAFKPRTLFFSANSSQHVALELQASKAFSKDFFAKYKLPTASYRTCGRVCERDRTNGSYQFQLWPTQRNSTAIDTKAKGGARAIKSTALEIAWTSRARTFKTGEHEAALKYVEDRGPGTS